MSKDRPLEQPIFDRTFGPLVAKERAAQTHYLKTWPRFFELVQKGLKPYEIRNNDRDFNVGDTLVLQEWDPTKSNGNPSSGYTGREARGKVSHVLEASELPGCPVDSGWVVLSVNWATRPAAARGVR